MEFRPQSKVRKQGQLITIGNQYQQVKNEKARPIFLTKTPVTKKERTWKRGKITTFSDASRRRIKRFLARVDYSSALFITLTAKEDFDFTKVRAFLKRMYRWIGVRPTVWRKEYQKRGTVHYHILILNTKRWITAKTMTKYWKEVLGVDPSEHVSTDVRFVQKGRVCNYITKYISKASEGSYERLGPLAKAVCDDLGGVAPGYLEGTIITGRQWGIENRTKLKFCKVVIIEFKDLDEDIQHYARRIDKFIREKGFNTDKITLVWWSL